MTEFAGDTPALYQPPERPEDDVHLLEFAGLTPEAAADLEPDAQAQYHAWRQRYEYAAANPAAYADALRQAWRDSRWVPSAPSIAGSPRAAFRDAWAPLVIQHMADNGVSQLVGEAEVPQLADYQEGIWWHNSPKSLQLLDRAVPLSLELVAHGSLRPGIRLPVWELPEQTQAAVLERVAGDLMALLELVYTLSPEEAELYAARYGFSVPAMRCSPADVVQAFDDYPTLDRAFVLRQYLERPRRYREFLEHAANPDTPPPRLPRPAVPRQLAARELQCREEQTAYREKHGLDEVPPAGTVITASTIQELDEIAMGLAGALHETATGGEETTESIWYFYTGPSDTSSPRIHELIKGRHYGPILNPRVVIMPVEPEHIGQWFRKSDKLESVRTDHLLRLVSAADIATTGRGIQGTAIVDSLIFLRQGKGGGETLGYRHKRRKDSDDAIKRIRAQSSFTHEHVLRHALQHLLPGGLPGLGKNS